MENYDIKKIEGLTRSEAEKLAEAHKVIKEYDIYFIDFKGYFGYSAVVFYGNQHITHANDYQLHHNRIKEKSKLYKYYIEELNKKLFTIAEIYDPINTYSEYRKKVEYIRNIHSQRQPAISAIYIGDEQKRELEKALKKQPESYYSNVSFSYYSSKSFVIELANLEKSLMNEREKQAENYDYLVKAFEYEYANYECIYGGRYSEAIEAVLGHGGKLTAVQERAAKAAKQNYEKYYD